MKDGKCYPELDSFPLENLMEKIQLPNVNLSGCIVAGGVIRDTLTKAKVNDIDIFGTPENHARFLENNKSLIMSRQTSPIGHTNLFIIGCEYPVQLIKTEVAESVLELLADFDIRMCRFAFDGTTLFYDREALSDAANKVIAIASFHTPYLTLSRMCKYINRGFSIERTRYKVLLGALRTMPEEDYVKEKQLIHNNEYNGAFPK